MKTVQVILFFVMIVMASGCNAEITGTVVDAETGEPVEGAVILVEWTVTKGLPGMSYKETSDTVEVLTDKNGKFSSTTILNPMVNQPAHLVIYKKGYVTWNNRYIFPKWNRREYEFKNGATIHLERFKGEYSHYDHISFIGSAAVSGSGGKLLENAYLWERILAEHETQKRKREKNEGRQ